MADAPAHQPVGLLAKNGSPVEQDLPCRGFEHAAETIEQRRLSGAIGTDQTDNLAGFDR